MACSPSAPASAFKAAALLRVPVPYAAAVAVARRAPAVPTVLRAAGGKARRGAALVAAAATDDLRAAIMSGEWPENFSHLSYDDLRAYLESQITTAGEMSPEARLMDVMSRPVQVATPGQRLAEVDAFFAAQQFSGLPVVDEDEGRCVGVVSKKDTAKAPNGMDSTVGEVMSSPAITLTLEKTVLGNLWSPKGLFGVPHETVQASPRAGIGSLVACTYLRARLSACKSLPAARLPSYAQIDLLCRAWLAGCSCFSPNDSISV